MAEMPRILGKSPSESWNWNSRENAPLRDSEGNLVEGGEGVRLLAWGTCFWKRGWKRFAADFRMKSETRDRHPGKF